MMRKLPAPIFTVDADGQELAHVALSNTDERVVMYADDFRRLMDAGFSSRWNFSSDRCGNAYPVMWASTVEGVRRGVAVARLIANAQRGERIHMRDGNSLNLRRENLHSESGPARLGATDWLPTVAACKAISWRASLPH